MDFNGVFGRESSHNHCQLTVGYRLDGMSICCTDSGREYRHGSLSQQSSCFSWASPTRSGMTRMTNN